MEHIHVATGKPFMKGAKKTPRHKLLWAHPHRKTGSVPTQWPNVLPSFLEMWLNDQYGDCVSAEEAAAIALYSVVNGLPESKITDATVKTFCDAYGFLNGADLTEVMDKMISNGFAQDKGYKDGPYTGVDYSNESILQSACYTGPVKVAIDADALPSGAGNNQGWFGLGGSPGQFSNTDHCVGIWGYGPIAYLVKLIETTFGVTISIPSNAPTNGYLLYTWSTIGIVDYAWIMSTVVEAWVRNPTTVGVTPTPPVPPTPIPGGKLFSLATNADGSMVFTPSSGGTIAGSTITFNADGTYTLANSNTTISITIPPAILKILQLMCPFASLIPPPMGPILVAICAVVPHGVKDDSLTVPISQELVNQIEAFKLTPKSNNPAFAQVEDWLRSLSFCKGCK